MRSDAFSGRCCALRRADASHKRGGLRLSVYVGYTGQVKRDFSVFHERGERVPKVGILPFKAQERDLLQSFRRFSTLRQGSGMCAGSVRLIPLPPDECN